jgi:hypothetical protein
MSHFDPQRLTPSISLNRVQLVDFPGLAVDPEVKGAVIMVGTALGIGFPPEADGWLAISPDLAILAPDKSQV